MDQEQEVFKHFVNPLKAGVTKFKGVMLPVCFKDYAKEIEDMEVRDTDIWVTSFPKSATFAPYWNNIYSYWNRRNLSNILFICYEEMKQDLASVIRKVTQFLGKRELNNNEMDCLVDHLSFLNMRKNPAVAKNELLASIYECMEEEETQATLQFMRVGKVGSYIGELSEEMIDILDKWIFENVEGTDFKMAL
ncbi:sulfotransferase sult [Holotrichia oblita]|uniref:Sulfotransferase sult n=1 Tax=Holotrichia oblita TaxID=644536 RepID=A0ACB9T893_HOLOL|nr:sulfotransferase sult [Holotrichia oblita]